MTPRLLWSHIRARGSLELHPAGSPATAPLAAIADGCLLCGAWGHWGRRGSELPRMGPGQQLHQGATSNSHIPPDFPVCGGGDPSIVQQRLCHEGQWAPKRNWSYKYHPTRDTGSRERPDRDRWARARLAPVLLLLLYSHPSSAQARPNQGRLSRKTSLHSPIHPFAPPSNHSPIHPPKHPSIHPPTQPPIHPSLEGVPGLGTVLTNKRASSWLM